jgi:cytidylate kinase
METHTTVITISRQMSSGGAYIGHLIAKKLGYKYIEREVLSWAAKDLGVGIADIARQDEKKTGFIERLLKSFLFGTPEAAYIPPSRRPVYDAELFKTESFIIREIAEKRNTVVVGHGGFSVLRGKPGLVNVFIHAPKEFRVKRLKEFHKVSTEQALAEIEESDNRRAKYIRTMTHSEWLDATNYHLAIDAQATGFEAAADMIIALVQKMKQA